MKSAELQHRIDCCATAADMTDIALAYLGGTVLRDRVAAEAWLMRAIDQNDPVHSPRAMGILARDILGKDRILPETDIPLLREKVATAQGREKAELEALLRLDHVKK